MILTILQYLDMVITSSFMYSESKRDFY